MLRRGHFSFDFDYEAVPADFVLCALVYAYPHSGFVDITKEALDRASMLFLGLAFLLENADSLGASGEIISQKIHDVLLGVQTSEAYELDGLLDLD